MASDLEVLAEIERLIGAKFAVIDPAKLSYGALTGYAIDDTEHVIVLAINGGRIRELPEQVLQLHQLKILDLFSNQLTSLPAEIAQFQNLQTLLLHSNQLASLPAEIGQLQNLQTLLLASNQLASLPAEIAQFQNLQTLDLCSNQLESLPAEISQLQNLQTLYLGSNYLTILPAEIGQLQNLQTLSLRSNNLTSLPTEIGRLQNLQTFDLRYNDLTSLPVEIDQLRMNYATSEFDQQRGSIKLDSNPLESPPWEIIYKGREAVIAYFRSLEGEELPLNEVKILLVGDGAVGKTSLVKRLVGKRFDPNESQTHGINIHHWRVKDDHRSVLGHFWDFGGQEIMHATHQFFLSKRSVYVLVLDGRKDEKTEYWLKTIESFGGNSPVLVVLNKLDQNPGFDVNRRFLQEKYRGIAGFFRVSCAKGKGIKAFRSALKETLGKVEILGTVWAKSWFNVKRNLEQMSDPFVSYGRYTDLCEDKGVKNKVGQNTLVDFLNDLGVIVHFQDFELQDVYVLEPRWVTEGVYKIINSKDLALAKGTIELRRLPGILTPHKAYPRDKQRYFIDLMKKFELCYELDKETVLVPDLLEVQEPAFDFDYENALRFRVDYDFLPRSVLPRFIVKMHKDIHERLRWRTGVVLKSATFQALAAVKCDYDAARIYIHVSGPRRRDYFAAMLYFLRDINNRFEKLTFMERVPLPDNPLVAVSYENLLRQEQAGIKEFIPDGGTRFYSVKELLGTVQNERSTNEQILEILQEILGKLEEGDKAGLSDFVDLRPNIAGVGVNLNTVLERIQRGIGIKPRR